MFRPLLQASLAALLLCLASPGCQPIDLGEAPFFCNLGNPQCPAGYQCKAKVCVREGASLPADGGTKDGPATKKDGPATKKDGPATKKDGPATKKDGPVIKKDTGGGGPLTILITEFMADPSKVSDSTGEWLELYNPGNTKVNINGWTLKDKGTDNEKIAHAGPLYVPAHGFLVLGRSTDKFNNGGAPVAYAYGAFFLANSADEVILLNEKGQVQDSFSYTNALPIPSGASLSVKTPGANKDLPASWCTETSAWNGSTGDKGTPLTKAGCK